MTTQRWAVLSVSDKTGLDRFARGLITRGYNLLSTGGTGKYLREQAEPIPFTEVSAYTGQPEIMNGRLKTLHPAVCGGILAEPEHATILIDNEWHRIDVVCVNLYPFQATVAKPDVKHKDAIENIDIGGPTMVRAGAKNYEYTTVVIRPDQYDRVLHAMDGNAVDFRVQRYMLATEVFRLTSAYDYAVAEYMSKTPLPGVK